METILHRGVFNTRPRDFYDTYILSTTKNFDKNLFTKALAATATHRGTIKQINNMLEIIKSIEDSSELKIMWDKYRKQFAYASNIEYDQIIAVLKNLIG